MIISANRYHRIASIGTIRTCSDLLHWHKFNRPIFVSKSDWPNMANRELEMSKLKKHFRCLRHRPRKGKSAICNPWLKVRFFGLTRKTSFRNCRLKPWVHQSTLYSSIGWKQSHPLSIGEKETTFNPKLSGMPSAGRGDPGGERRDRPHPSLWQGSAIHKRRINLRALWGRHTPQHAREEDAH